MRSAQNQVNAIRSLLCHTGAVLLLLSAGTLFKPALAQTYGPTDCDPANPFDDYNQPDCCPPYDISCNPYGSDPYPNDPGPGDGGDSTPSDPPQPTQTCLDWDQKRLGNACYDDPGPNGFNFNQPLSPTAGTHETYAYQTMQGHLGSVADGIFAEHTRCYASIGMSKKPCDITFIARLGHACSQPTTLAGQLTIIPCFIAAKLLTATMADNSVLDAIAGLDILSSVTLGASQDLRDAANWHNEKIMSIRDAKKCASIWNEGRAKQCIP